MPTLTPVTFRFPSVLVPSAQHVSLVGPFNNWTPNVHPLARTGNGWWIVTVSFQPGERVVYAFDVDGTTWLDPNDHAKAPNGWGAESSVRNVEPLVEPSVLASGETSIRPSVVAHRPLSAVRRKPKKHFP
jgi:1,4-alpha-glucan branching enzyme